MDGSSRPAQLGAIRESAARVFGRSDLVVLLLAIIAGTAVVGYQFGVDNHFDIVPIVRRFTDPQALRGDWYVDAATRSGVRAGFSVIAGGLSLVIGEWQAFFGTQLVTVAILVSGILRLARGLGLRPNGAAAATLLAVLGGVGSVGLSVVLDPVLAPQTMAWALLIWAIDALLRGRFEVAAALIGLASLVHPQLAVSCAAILAAWSLLGGAPRPTIRRAVQSIVAFGVVGGLALGPSLAAVLARSTVDGSTLVHIIAQQRLPWHMDPRTFTRYEWVSLAAALGAIAMTARDGRFASLRRLVAIVLASCVVGEAGLLLGIPTVVELQFFRLTPLIPLVVALIVGDRVGSLLASAFEPPVPRLASTAKTMDRVSSNLAPGLLAGALVLTLVNRDWPGQLLLVSVIPLLFIAQRLGGGDQPAARRTGMAAIAVSLVVIAIALGIGVWRSDLRPVTGLLLVALAVFVAARDSTVPLGLVRRERFIGGALLSSGATLFLVVAIAAGNVVLPPAIAPFLGQLRAQTQPIDDLDVLAAWSSGTLPAGSLVLAPPGEPGWRLWSGLPEVVDFKSFPYGGADVVEWQRRIEDVSGLADFSPGTSVGQASTTLDVAYRSRSVEDLGSVARRYGALYVVIPSDADGTCSPLHVQGDWALVESTASCVSP